MATLDLGRGFNYPVTLNAGGIDTAEGMNHLGVCIFMRLATRKGERIIRPWFGSDLWKYVDWPSNDNTYAYMRNEIYQALKDEDRFEIVSIAITSEVPGHVNIVIGLMLKNGIAAAFALDYNREIGRWEGGWAA